MSGHSKWSSIKHKKALTDSKRGKVFTKLIRELTMAAKEGGGNQDANPRLRTAILKAKEANMPGDNIDRAIKRGTGELPGVIFEQIIYEGYGPHGVAVMVETFTDNKNRTSSDVRNIFMKKGGNLGGSVAWLFHKKGYIMVNKPDADEDKLMSIALDNGAEDFTIGENSYEVTTDQRDFEKVRSAIVDAKIPIQASEITMIPTSTIKLTGESAKQVLSLVEELEDHEDVQNVYANFDIPDTILTQSAEEEEKSKG